MSFIQHKRQYEKFCYITIVVKTFSHLIEDNCSTKRTAELVCLSIPILIRWAQSGITTNAYGDLIKELGMVRFSGIGHTLGCIECVMTALREKTGEPIPMLNALVHGKDGLPSDGFKFVYPDYDNYPSEVKTALVQAENKKAVEYQHWDAVLKALCLKPSAINSLKDETVIRSGKHYGTGEGPRHKKLKEYIYAHPESLGIRNVTRKEMEYFLLSGDRLDVYFEQKDGLRVAVEVKSAISPDDDILRGLYQCIKYKAVMDAESKAHGEFSDCRAILVMEGALSISNQQVKDSLGVFVIEELEKIV